MSETFLPYGRQDISEADIAAVVDVLRSDWLTTGPAVPAFEAEFKAQTGAPHALACANGTAALHLALSGLGVGPGDICIVPAITFLATANAALYCGADVVFADVDPETGLMTPESFKAALSEAGPAAKTVLPVHLAGQTVDMAALAGIARDAGLLIIEDACHAIGTTSPTGQVGACDLSDAASFSFHPVKTIAAGEGGLVATRHADLAERIALLRSHGVERDPARHHRQEGEPWWHEMQALGWNYRLTDIQAALARSQLVRLSTFAAKRRALAARYDTLLDGRIAHLQPMARVAGLETCLHLYTVRIDFEALGLSRAAVMAGLKDRGIGTQVHYIPVCDQPFYLESHGPQAIPGARHYYARTLSLPLYTGMELEDVDRVVGALDAVLAG